MNSLLASISDADWLNPIVVKELRQAVRSRLVVAVLMLFLGINVAVLGGYLTLTPEAAVSPNAGETLFIALMVPLLITCIGFVPLYAGVRMSLERNDADLDLLSATAITPWGIVRGKYLAAMALTLLIFSACAPFIAVTYQLKGIDLPSIFTFLGAAFVACALANALGVFGGSLPKGVRWAALGAVLLLVGCAVLPFVWRTAAWLLSDIVEQLAWVLFGEVKGGPPGSWQFWASVGTVLGNVALEIGLLLAFSVVLVSPKQSNRMLVARLSAMAAWAIAGIIAATWAHSSKKCEPLLPWMVRSGILWMLMLWLALGEREDWGRRVRRTIPRSPLGRGAAFLLYGGSAGGTIWCVLTFAATVLATVVCGIAFDSRFGPGLYEYYIAWRSHGVHTSHYYEPCEVIDTLVMIFANVLCYSMIVAFFRMRMPQRVATATLPLCTLAVGGVLCALPNLAALAISPYWREMASWRMLASPLVFMTESLGPRYMASPLAVVWLALCVVLGAPWVRAQWRRFVP